jgi:hypothetical protein
MLVVRAVEVATNKMQIKITKTIDISPENVGLLPVVASYYGNEGEVNDFVVDFLTKVETEGTQNLIRPPVTQYFGKVMEETAIAVSHQIDNSVTVTVEIINDEPNN